MAARINPASRERLDLLPQRRRRPAPPDRGWLSLRVALQTASSSVARSVGVS
jgi:hypothetical protein